MKRFRVKPGDPILPLGLTNLKTGHSPVFNIYTTWDPKDTTAEIWRKANGKHVLIITSGNTPIYEVGTINRYKHDQTWNPFFYDNKEYTYNVEMVDWATLENLPSKIEKYGSKLRSYVYK